MNSAVVSIDEAKQLPIRRYAEDIVQAVKDHPTVIVLGETGSGKTTQISQILLESGFAENGQIAITQPRRVAAVTVAKRVAEELGVQLGKEVGYTVRFENCTSPDTKIKYLTDGTLLRECLDDAQLSNYSVIVLDEAHERSLSTDILFGVLKKLVKNRQPPLKLVVTSATLDGEKFSAYFDECPVFSVPGRCYPVDIIHTLDDHTSDYADAAVDVVMQLHTEQPPGDILVFLTGQAEIDKCLARISQEIAGMPDGSCGPLLLLPLYAALPPEMQVRVFRPAPEGTRRCIVATNVAETSVTVDGVVYVVDSGMVKLKSYVPSTGMDSLDVMPTSRVGATQRAGRAGRTRPGKCFRLYSKQFYDRTMPDVTPPEIQRTSLAGAVLHLKSLALDIDVLTFDFLDPPSRASLEDALRTLYLLDALDVSGRVTDIGRAMAALPLEPALARCLLAASECKCLNEAITIAAMLSSERVFEQGRGPADVRPDHQGNDGGGRRGGGKGPSPQLKALMAEGMGDHFLMLRLWESWAVSGFSRGALHDLGLDARGMGFARDVRKQLEGVMTSSTPGHGRHHRAKGQEDRGRQLTGGLHSDTGVVQASNERVDEKGAGGDSSTGRRESRGRERKRSRSRDRKQRERKLSRERDGQGGDGHRHERGRGTSPMDRQRDDGGGSTVAVPNITETSLTPYHFASEDRRTAAITKAITVGYAHKLARRLPRHNGYRTLGTGVEIGGGQLAQLHPTCAGLKEDADGMLPEWVVYHELVSTSRPFLRQVCATQYMFVEPLLTKIAKIDVLRLSRGKDIPATEAVVIKASAVAGGAGSGAVGVGSKPAKKDDAAVDAVRQRYLQRKGKAAGS